MVGVSSPAHGHVCATMMANVLSLQAPKTPQQRRAVAKFEKEQQAKMGTYKAPKVDKETRRKMELSGKFGTQGSTVGKGMVCESAWLPRPTIHLLLSRDARHCTC